MPKKEKIPEAVWIILVIIAIIVLANKDFSSQSTFNVDTTATTSPLITTTTLEDCGLSISPLADYPGEVFSGTFSGLPLSRCELFVNYEDAGWTSVGNFMTDGSGYYSTSTTPDIPGTYNFYVQCGYCDSNIVEVEVYAPCRETDGGDDPFVFGSTITDSGNLDDYCLDGTNLVEYMCLGDLGTGKSYNCDLLDAECVEGRCRTWDFDSDGDGWSDSDEEFYGTDPHNPGDAPDDGWLGGNCAELCDYLNPGNSGFCGYYEPGEPIWDCAYEGIIGWYPHNEIADEHCSTSWGIPYCCCYGM